MRALPFLFSCVGIVFDLHGICAGCNSIQFATFFDNIYFSCAHTSWHSHTHKHTHYPNTLVDVIRFCNSVWRRVCTTLSQGECTSNLSHCKIAATNKLLDIFGMKHFYSFSLFSFFFLFQFGVYPLIFNFIDLLISILRKKLSSFSLSANTKVRKHSFPIPVSSLWSILCFEFIESGMSSLHIVNGTFTSFNLLCVRMLTTFTEIFLITTKS